MLEKLKGYKTYAIAVLTLLGAVGAYLNHSIDLQGLFEAVQVSLVAMGLRAGIGGLK